MQRKVVRTLALAASLALAAPVGAQSAGLAVTSDMMAPPRVPAGEPMMQQPVADPTSGARVMARPRPVPPGGGGAGIGAPAHAGGMVGPGRPRPQPVTIPTTPGIRILATLRRVEGSIPRPTAQQAMPQLELIAAQCYTEALRLNPSAQGLMVARMSVLPTGTVAEVEETANYVHDSSLSVCLVNRFPTARFRPFAGASPGFVMIQIRFLQH
ncbi:MAG: hypothetical protein WCJ30_12350 [Deltaproteobacteria bacterium]